MCKVSIIIPVYNVEKYLDECIQSVLRQTLKDIEIICVDDGSTDGSLRIMEKYARKDNRVRIIQKKNSGYGDSVNKGIDNASGEYIGIIESDDYVDVNMFYDLYNLAIENDLDAIYSNQIRFYDEDETRVFYETIITKDNTLYNRVLNPTNEKRIFLGNYLNQTGLYKRQFLERENIRHNVTPGASYQDIGFCFQILAFAKRIMLFDKGFYFYRQDNPNSSIASSGKMDYVIYEYKYIYKILKERGKFEAFCPEYNRRRYGSYLYTYERLDWNLKKEFVEKMNAEFVSSKEKGELDLSVCTPNWKEDIKLILNNPIQFYEKYERLKDVVYQQIDSSGDFVIYGAGLIGKKVYDLLEKKDRDRVLGFAVTNIDMNNLVYKNKKIVPIQNYEIYKDHLPVLICVAKKYKEEIIANLQNYKFQKYIVLCDEIIDEW